MTTRTPPCVWSDENGAMNSSSSRSPAVFCNSKYCGRRSVSSVSSSASCPKSSSNVVVESSPRASIWLAAGLQWISAPETEKAMTPSVMCKNSVESLLRSFSASEIVSSRTFAMWLKFRASTPISSWPSTATRCEKSPAATCRVPTVSAWIGVIRMRASRNESTTQITRPRPSARRIMLISSLVSASTVARLS